MQSLHFTFRAFPNTCSCPCALSPPQPRAPSDLLSDSVDLPFLDFCCKWNHTIQHLRCRAPFPGRGVFEVPVQPVGAAPSRHHRAVSTGNGPAHPSTGIWLLPSSAVVTVQLRTRGLSLCGRVSPSLGWMRRSGPPGVSCHHFTLAPTVLSSRLSTSSPSWWCLMPAVLLGVRWVSLWVWTALP